MTELADADRLHVSLTVSEIDALREVLACLEEIDASIEPEGMTVVDPHEDDLVEIDIGSITPKQWEALELAYNRGYYERPREADLEELATELDISKSAVSQRLRAAETRLVAAVLRSVSPWVVRTRAP